MPIKYLPLVPCSALVLFLATPCLAEDFSVPGVKIEGGKITAPGVTIDSSGIRTGDVNIDSSGIKTGDVKIDSTGIKTKDAQIDSSGIKTSAATVGMKKDIKKAEEITRALSSKNAKVDLTVNFDQDSDKIQAQAQGQLMEIANSLKSESLKSARVRIEGYTDGNGTVESKKELSLKRAVAITRELGENHGITPDRLEVKGNTESDSNITIVRLD